MNKKNCLFSLLTIMMAAVLSVSITSCGGDDPVSSPPVIPTNNGNVTNPDTEVPDPEGTITLSMRNANNGTTYIDNSIYINRSDNFTGCKIVSLGAMKGLGNIAQIPKTGWSDQVAVVPGTGYVAYANNKYYCLYVVEEITNTSGGVIGALVKYYSPFGGKDEAVQLEKNELSFTTEGGSQTVKMTNSSIIAFKVSSSESWCHPYVTTTDDSKVPNAVQISVDRNAPSNEAIVTLETLTGKKTTIKVSTTPTLTLNRTEMEFGPSASTDGVVVYGNVDLSQITATSDVTWCTVTPEGTTRTDYDNQKYTGLKITVIANPAETERIANITVKSKDNTATATLKVIQRPGYLTPETSNVSFNYSASSKTVNVRGNVDLTQLTITSDASWCTATTDGRVYQTTTNGQTSNYTKLTITVTPNALESQRTATITIKAKECAATTTVKVTQSGGYLNVSVKEMNFDKNSNYRTITITTSATEWEAVSSASWCTFSKNGNELTIRATASTVDRIATISFKNFSTTVKVHQSKYAVGNAYNENGVQGTVAYIGDNKRFIVSNELGKVAWSTENVSTGASDQYDGTKNMEVIRSIPNYMSLYPAFALIENLNESMGGDWYLPAYDETERIHVSIASAYWSSTEGGHDSAWVQQSSSNPRKKSIQFSVYAIRKF